MELAVEDFSGGELEELVPSWLEIIELVITFFCCKNNNVLVRKAVCTEPLSRCRAQYSTRVVDPDPGSGLDPYSIGSVDPDPDSESGSGSRRAKITHKSRQ
jgi:hypothetical protein